MSAPVRCGAHFGTSDRRCTRVAGHSQPLHTIPGEVSWPDALVMRRTDITRYRTGELFAGVGGLGMAVDEVFGAEPAWFCEFDGAPSKVLAHHFPDVPNFGDVRAVDWAAVEHPSILAGGFPCQDVSLAGRRRGMKDGTRSGLWSEFAKAIDEIRPDWVVIENVRGLLSADAAVDMEPCPLCVGEDPEHVLRALGAVLGDLAELGFDAEWAGIRASDIGAPHGRFRVFILAWPRERATPDTGHRTGDRQRARTEPRQGGEAARLKLLSTPDTVPEAPNTGSNSHKAGNVVGLGNQVMSLLPTPDAYSGNRGGSQDPDKRRDGGHTVSLADVAEHRLLGTPRVASAHGAGSLERRQAETNIESQVLLLPTPNVAMADGGQTSRSGDRRGERLLGGIAADSADNQLMPTPRATRGGSSTEMSYAMGGHRSDEERPQGVVTPGANWGPYAAAIIRWERTIGRGAPAPVRNDGKGGKPRLNPELTEWMMGWPAGWVTNPGIGLSRAEQLKACGNGVVPQQAAAAIREMLARPGVPALTRELVA